MTDDGDRSIDAPQEAPPTPDAILELGFAFWASRTLLTATELGVFSELARAKELDVEAVRERLDLHGRGLRDFLDALVALGMLEREDGLYRNTPATDLFLDGSKPGYVGGILEMASSSMYRTWDLLAEALRTGKPQNEAKDADDTFAAVYADPARLRGFVKAMTGVSVGAARALAQAFPWERYQTVIDVGCSEGCVLVELALAHGHLSGGGFDLPPVGPLFDEYVAAAGFGDRLRFHPGNFFEDPLPSADVLIMGHILHDWNGDEKLRLLDKACSALAEGGALIVYEAIIDDARRENAFGLLMSLNMLVATAGGFDYTGGEIQQWMRQAGFRETRVEHLHGPHSMAVGIK